MAATDEAWLPPSIVGGQLVVTLDQAGELPEAAELARLAAAQYVRQARGDLFPLDGEPVVGPLVVQGAALLAARLYARRSSPTGLASYGEFGPAQVLRFDPDVERMLGLGRYARPVIG